MKPNPEFIKDVLAEDRKKWARLLLATQRHQARKQMVDADGGWCCLMVGLKAFGGIEAEHTGDLPLLSSSFAIAMEDNNPVIAIEEETLWPTTASECNDKYQLSFTEIAALVYPEAANNIEEQIA